MSAEVERPYSHTLTELRKHLKSKSKGHMLGCLNRIKSDAHSSKRFVRAGGLELLVQLLRFQDVKIINTVLSILANLCMNSDTRQQVRDTDIVVNVLWILDNLNSNENLHCRACRLIGNLSDCSWYAKAFYDKGAVQILHAVLHTKTNTQTYLMAIRAVRNIWSMHEQSREKIIASGLIKTVTRMFISAGKKLNTSRYLDLAETCMKAMAAFLVGSNNDCAQQMAGENYNSYRTLVTFLNAQNKLSVKCMYGLALIAECRPILGTCNAVEVVVRLIEERSPHLSELVAILCLFCREAINRRRIRYCSGIPTMLEMLKQKEHERYHPVLLHALVLFVYDDESIAIMVKNGLLDILTDKMKQMAIEMPDDDDTDEIATMKKRGPDCSPDRKYDAKFSRTNGGRFSLDFHQDDWSPRSGSSTPPGTPPMKLFHDMDDSDDNAEDNYSPVCSDTEWADEEPQEEMESLKSFSSATIEETQESIKVSKTEVNKHMNVWTLALLSKLSYLNQPIERLADPVMIGSLATCIKFANNPKASRILSRIVKNKAYLIPLIKQGFVFEAQDLSGPEQYARDLSALAETGPAIGELSSLLLRGQEPHRRVIAISIPFLIKSREQLRFLLNCQGALSLIFEALANREHQLHKEAVWSICHLADSLDVRPEVLDKSQFADSSMTLHDTGPSIENPVKPSTVTFELDDGSTVDACRRMLCQRSDYFSTMLEGSFSESGKRRVKLHNTSKDGLMILLLAVSGSEFDDNHIEGLLDAVLLADKFLMTDVSEQLTESSISKLNSENFCRAWIWARSNDCHDLKSCCVKSFLTMKMTKAERLRAFTEFASNDNFSEFLNEVKEIINTVLVQR